MEASALPASVGLTRPRLAFGASLLRIRSDDQLVSLFRAGNEEAFRVIHDRYRVRLHAYTRQMLAGSPHDCEDALQEVFVRAYFGLRTNRRDLALRPWLYRVAHNRCVDELRRPPLALVEPDDNLSGGALDPVEQVEQRDALRRLISDVQRLPDQQRSALLMRELSGMSYQEVAHALAVSVPAVKSLLVRARVGLAQATEARDTSCAQIREELILAHDRKVRASGLARRHLSECADCRHFRAEMRGASRQLAALAPTIGPIGVIANLLGFGGGGATVGGGTAAAGGVAGGAGVAASAGLFATGHVVTLLAAAVVTAGGAVELQKTIIAPPAHHVRHRVVRAGGHGGGSAASAASAIAAATPLTPTAPVTSAASSVMVAAAAVSAAHAAAPSGHAPAPLPISQLLDPDHLAFIRISRGAGAGATASTGVAANGGTTTSGPSVSSPSPVPILPPAASGLTLSATGAPSTSTATTTPGSTAGSPGTSGTASAGSTPASDTSSSAGGTGTTVAPGVNSTQGGTATGSTQASLGSTPATGSGNAAGTSNATAHPTTGSSALVGTNVPVSARALARSGSTVARTVAAGGATGGHVVTFLATRRHAHSHGFTLGTLLAR